MLRQVLERLMVIVTNFGLLSGAALLAPSGCSTSDCRSFTDVEEAWKKSLRGAVDCGASLEIGSSEVDEVAACLAARQEQCEPAFAMMITSGSSDLSPSLLRSFFILENCSVVILEYDQPDLATRERFCDTLSLSEDERFVIIGSDCHDGDTYTCPM